MTPEADHRRSEGLQPARPRRRGISHRHEVELRAAHLAQAEVHRGQCATRASRAPAKIALLIENDPHQLIEGMLIAGLAVDAHAGYIYIRGEYRYLIDIMDKAIAEAYATGWLGKNIQGTGFDFDLLHAYRRGRVRVRRGIGAARIARRQARHSAHPAAVSGRGGRVPVPHRAEQRRDVLRGAGDHSRWRRGVRGARARRRTAARGCSASPATSTSPAFTSCRMGFNLMRMINEVGGGMRDGKKLKAVIPGGSSLPGAEGRRVRRRDHGLRFPGAAQEHAGVGRRRHHGRRHRAW